MPKLQQSWRAQMQGLLMTKLSRNTTPRIRSAMTYTTNVFLKLAASLIAFLAPVITAST